MGSKKALESMREKSIKELVDAGEYTGHHEVEVTEFMDNSKETLALLGAESIISGPLLLILGSLLLEVMTLASVYGYYKGRTYQDVPEVFKRGMEK